MLTKLRTLASLYRDLGFRWMLFRAAYAFRLRSGLIHLQMPQYKWTDRPLETWLKQPLRAERSAGRVERVFFSLVSRPNAVEAPLSPNIPWNKQTAIDEADRILSGEIKYFAHEFHQIGFPPNWHKAPVTLLPPQANLNRHWPQISDSTTTDIKFIWEPNRFAFVYTLVRAYVASQDEKYAEAFWSSVLDWAEHNPPNTGPNWMDGQEIALRLMAWTFGLYQFSNSPASSPQRISQFTQYVAAQAERIYKNIGYAISTRSNHTISEAFGLWMVGLLFPKLKDSEKYLKLGRELLEREASTQIFPDGSYAMYSLNYHRFVLQIYLYALRLGELNGSPFSNHVYRAATSSIEYLYQLIDPQTGQMPVYGSNDGALILPLNNCDFTDYRPLLQLGSFITKGKRLFESGEWDEDIFWLCGLSPLSSQRERAGVRESQSSMSFSDGGIYILRNTNSKAIIRCTDYRARPSHADQLHVDIWFRDKNIACDAGTYLYSGKGVWQNGLAHTATHNTVIVDSKDQMKMASRFTWTDWSKGKVLKHEKNLWQGEHDGYKPVNHKRTVVSLEGDRWLVVDHLNAKHPHHYALHWLLNDFPYISSDSGVLELAAALPDTELSDSRVKVQVGLVEGNSTFSIVRADPNFTRGWRSRYYGYKEPAISVMLETDLSQACFWTFFGFESDSIELMGDVLRINSFEINLKTVDDRP